MFVLNLKTCDTINLYMESDDADDECDRGGGGGVIGRVLVKQYSTFGACPSPELDSRCFCR